jgi:hypothetical protein
LVFHESWRTLGLRWQSVWETGAERYHHQDEGNASLGGGRYGFLGLTPGPSTILGDELDAMSASPHHVVWQCPPIGESYQQIRLSGRVVFFAMRQTGQDLIKDLLTAYTFCKERRYLGQSMKTL